MTSDGRVAVMNDVAYRILGLKPRTNDIGRHYTEVLKDEPDITRMVTSAFELSHLPNRAELRLKTTGKVIGYTLSQVRDRHGRVTGATLFFKDLTRVEQLEERERLRDRLAALGEMAAAIAHEVKNPLAGIEVMAGLLKRQLADSQDAQAILADIIKEAKMANAIVLEVLEFVRPIRLQVERVSLGEAITDAVSLSEGHEPRGQVAIDVSLPADLPAIQGDPHQLRQIFTNLLINAYEALNGHGRSASRRRRCPRRTCLAAARTSAAPRCWSRSSTTDQGWRRKWWTRFSARSSPRSRRARGSDSRLSERLSTRTMAASTSTAGRDKGRRSASRCR